METSTKTKFKPLLPTEKDGFYIIFVDNATFSHVLIFPFVHFSLFKIFSIK